MTRRENQRRSRGRTGAIRLVVIGLCAIVGVHAAVADDALLVTQLIEAERALALGDAVGAIEAANAVRARTAKGSEADLSARILRGRAQLVLGRADLARLDLESVVRATSDLGSWAASTLARDAGLELGNLELVEGRFATARARSKPSDQLSLNPDFLIGSESV